MTIQQWRDRWMRLLVTAILAACPGFETDDGAQPPITALTCSLDNRSLISGSQRGLKVVGWPQLNVERSIDCELDNVHDLAFSPDGKYLLVAGGSPGAAGIVQLRSWPELRLERSWQEHQDLVYKVAWRADGQEWVSASWDGYCKVCGLNANSAQTTMKNHSGPIFAVTYLKDGTIATAGADRTIVVWKPKSGEAIRVLRQHTGTVHAIALQPVLNGNGTRLLASAGDDRTVRFWQPEIGRMVRFHRFASPPRAIAWSPDGRWLFVGCDDGRVVKLDPVSLSFSVLSDQHPRLLNIIASADQEKIVFTEDSELKVVELPK